MFSLTDLATPIAALDAAITDPARGLPEDVFLFASRITPLVNVDLLIKNEQGQTLLTWRHSLYYPPGWHIPGGIIRYKESMASRIVAVADTELGAQVSFDPPPLAIRETMHPPEWRIRGHFISFLFRCRLLSPPDPSLRYETGGPTSGQWKWHTSCPSDLLMVHEMYREFI